MVARTEYNSIEMRVHSLKRLSKAARLSERLKLLMQSSISTHYDSSSLSQLISLVGRLPLSFHRNLSLYPVTLNLIFLPCLFISLICLYRVHFPSYS